MVDSALSDRTRGRTLLVLLFLAACLRLWVPAHARFTGDESHQFSVAEQITHLRAFPAYGLEVTSSAAKHPGPLAYFLIAIPQLLSDSPLAGGLFVALLHLFVLVLWVRTLQRIAGADVATLFGILVAFAPWDILYGDRIWGSSLAPIFGSLALYGLIEAMTTQHAVRGLALMVSCALVLPQLHLSAPIVWMTLLTLGWLERDQLRQIGKASVLRGLILGVGIAVVAYAPAIIRELATGFANTRALLGHAGGNAPAEARAALPAQMLGYSVLYSSAEIGYHFSRGYWGGHFDDAQAYFSERGWRDHWNRHGIFSLFALASVLIAGLGWVACAVRIIRKSRREIDDRIVLALGSGVVAGAVLLVLAKKGFFPHYGNVLVPLLIFPVALGLSTLGRTGFVLAALSAATMGVSTARYYLEVDRLNGVTLSTALVERIHAENAPVSLSFDHFDNRYALDRLSEVTLGEPLRLSSSSRIRYRVHNSSEHKGTVPAGSEIIDGTRVERTETAKEPAPAGLVFQASTAVERLRVDVFGDSRSVERSCTAAHECRYGDEPWRVLRRQELNLGGRPVDLLFVHPISRKSVRVTVPIVPGANRALVKLGLTDEAVQSGAEPVQVTVDGLEGGPRSLTLSQKPGLHEISGSFSATATVTVEIRTQNDGARVMGLEVFELQ